jgi:hypothetical protein
MEVLIISLARPFNGIELTLFEILLYSGLWDLAWVLYEFEHSVIYFNHRNPLRLLTSTAGLEDLSIRILQAEAETSDPDRIAQLHEPITELHSRPTAQGRATPIEIAVIHRSLEIYHVLLPIVLQVLSNRATRRTLFTSLIDYSVRFSPHLVDVVRQDALHHAQMHLSDLVSFSLRNGSFSTARALFAHFQEQGEMNENDLIEVIVALLANYANDDNVESIRTFFLSGRRFLPQGDQFWSALQERLIEQVFMRAVEVQDPNRPRRQNVSDALLDGLRDGFTSNQLERSIDLARLSGQQQVLRELRLILHTMMGRFEITPDVPRKRRRRDL